MNKTYTLLLLLILCTTGAFAQTYTLDISKAKIPALLDGYYIEEVIDGRVVKNSIGVVQRSILNNKVPAVFAAPLEKELLNFITSQQPAQSGKIPIILRVNKLWISEFTTTNSESGTAELRVDFIYKQDSVYKKLYSTIVFHTQKGLEVTGKHDDNIAQVIGKCFQQFNANDFDVMLSQAENLSLQQLSASYVDKTTAKVYPILQVKSTYKKGIYITLEEFRNNEPSITSNFEIKHRSGFDQVMVGGGDAIPVLVSDDGKLTKIKNAWGFTDGVNLYMRTGEGYYPLVLIDGEFKFMGPPANNNGSAAIAAGAVTGGVVGGLIAGGIVAATTNPAEYTLDLETGVIKIGNTPVGMDPRPAKLILYRELKQEQPHDVEVVLNGQIFPLSTNQMYEVDLDTNGAGTTICLNNDESSCNKFMPVPGRTYYYACTFKNITKAELKKVDEKLGVYAVKGIKFANQKAEKNKRKE